MSPLLNLEIPTPEALIWATVPQEIRPLVRPAIEVRASGGTYVYAQGLVDLSPALPYVRALERVWRLRELQQEIPRLQTELAQLRAEVQLP